MGILTGQGEGFLNKFELMRLMRGVKSVFVRNVDLIPSLTQDKNLVSNSIISTTWTGIYSGSGTSVVAELGSTVTFNGAWKWVHNDSYKDPQTCSGTWGTALPASNVSSGQLGTAITKTNSGSYENYTIASQTISAPKVGLMVQSNKIVAASGDDTSTASATVKFMGLRYIGKKSNTNYTPGTTQITTSFIQGLDSLTGPSLSAMASSKGFNANSVSGITSNDYVFYAYPKAFGALTAIYLGSAINQINAWERLEFTYVGTQNQNIPYYVYVSRNTGIPQNCFYTFE